MRTHACSYARARERARTHRGMYTLLTYAYVWVPHTHTHTHPPTLPPQVVYGVFNIMEHAMKFIVMMIPYYGFFKMCFLIFCYHPTPRAPQKCVRVCVRVFPCPGGYQKPRNCAKQWKVGTKHQLKRKRN